MEKELNENTEVNLKQKHEKSIDSNERRDGTADERVHPLVHG